MVMNTVDAEIVNENRAVTVREKSAVAVRLTERDIETLVAVGVIPKGTPADVIEFFGKSCAETRLSPFKRQIHLIKRWSRDGDRYTIQTGIDGYRATADRTGRYAGNDEYAFDEGLREYDMIKAGRMRPSTATSTVYKVVGNLRCPFSATARWDEYYPGDKQGFMWDKMPFLMLGKCAEALALRKAFPDELAGVYTDEEMAQADVRNVPKAAQKPPQQPGNDPEDDLPFENASPAPNTPKSPQDAPQGKSGPVSPKSSPQPKPAPAVGAIEATEDQKAKLIAMLGGEPEGRMRALMYFIEIGALMPTGEGLEDLPLRFVPRMAYQMRELGERIMKLANHGKAEKCVWFFDHTTPAKAKAAPPAPPAATPKPAVQAKPKDDEWWREIIVPVPRKGMKRDAYLRNPDTIGSLFALRHGNDEESQAARQRLWGFVTNYEAKGWEKRNGEHVPPSAGDIKFREALDAFNDWFEKNHPDEKL